MKSVAETKHKSKIAIKQVIIRVRLVYSEFVLRKIILMNKKTENSWPNQECQQIRHNKNIK